MTALPVGTATAAPDRRRRGWWRVLLAVSLALNFCFVAGAVWARLHGPPTGAERLGEIGRDLHLNDGQNAAFRDFARAMRARGELARAEVEPLLGNAWSEIAKPQADLAQIMKILDQAAEKRRSFQSDATADTLKFLGTLSPEQRNQFVALAREHRTPWFGPFPAQHHPPR